MRSIFRGPASASTDTPVWYSPTLPPPLLPSPLLPLLPLLCTPDPSPQLLLLLLLLLLSVASSSWMRLSAASHSDLGLGPAGPVPPALPNGSSRDQANRARLGLILPALAKPPGGQGEAQAVGPRCETSYPMEV